MLKRTLSFTFALALMASTSTLGLKAEETNDAPQSGVVIADNTDFADADCSKQATFTLVGDYESVTMSNSFNYWTQEDWANYNAGKTDGMKMKSLYEYKNGMFETGYPAVGEGYTYALEEVEENVWQITVPVHAGMYYYGYNVTTLDENGKAVETKVLDPSNLPEAHPFNNHDCGWSLLYVDGDDVLAGQEYVLPTDAPKGSLNWVTYTATDGTEQPLGVYLPAGYDSSKKYPVVYVSHGGGGNEADWMTIGDIPTILDNLIAEGSAVEMIAVTMDNTYFGWDMDKIKKNLMECIVPYIESNYSVNATPEARGFCGLSMGGLTTTSVYSTLAPSFQYLGPWSATNGGDLDLSKVEGATYPYVMLGYGCMDFGKGGYPAFGNNLAKAGVAFTEYEVGGAHDWGVWRDLFTKFAKNFLFKEVEATPAGVVVSKNTDFPDAETDYQATITYRGDADSVTLSSSFNYWTQEDWKNYNEGKTDGMQMKSLYEYKKGMFETGYPAVGEGYTYALEEIAPSVWQIKVPVHAGMYYYGFNVTKNGTETKVLDKSNLPEAHPYNNHDCGWSLFYVDGEDVLKGQEYVLPTDAKKGTLNWDIYTATDGTVQPLGVYLPAGYDSSKKYPVAYVSHGGGGNEADWMTIGDIPTILDNLIAKGEVKPMIAVTMDNTYWGWNYDKIKKNLMECIIPYMENKYNVSASASDRAFCGLSMGGLTTTSVYSTLAHEFGYFGPWSATNGGDLDLTTVKDAGMPVIMLGYGCMDFGKGGYPKFKENLDKSSIAYSDYEVGGAHDWGVWRELFTIFAKDYLWEGKETDAKPGFTWAANTVEDWKAPYVATFTYKNDSGKDIESICVKGGWQFYKEDEVGTFVGMGDNSGIPCYSAYEYEEGMFAGSSSTQTGDMIEYPMTKIGVDLWQVQIPCPANQYFYAYFIKYTDGSVAEKVYDPYNMPKAAPSGSDAGWSLALVGDSTKAVKGQEFIYPRTDGKVGRVSYQAYTAEDGTEQWVGVYTPYGYNVDTVYPTIYVSHGGGGNEDEWFTIGSIKNIMDNLVAQGLTQEAIVVTMNNTYFNWDYDRIFDNTLNCIIPFIEANYSVGTTSDTRAFCGLSMGSMTTNMFAIHHPEAFDYFGSFSGGMQNLKKEDVQVDVLKNKVLYLTAGNIDMAYNNPLGISSVDFMKVYDELGVKYTFDLLGGSHDWYVWRESFTNFAKDYLWKSGFDFTGFIFDGELYWYEHGVKQGVVGDPLNITDTQYNHVERGREIYDPTTDAWYWLDADNDGAVAKNKEVWMPYIFQDEEKGSTEGKWVRYDKYGEMIKGWYANDNGVYYYDLETGAMLKGTHEINGKTYTFDLITGIRQ